MIRDDEQQQAPEVWWRGTSSTKAMVVGRWMTSSRLTDAELYELAQQIAAEMRQRYPRDYCFKCGRKLLRHESRACQFCIERDRKDLNDLGPFRLR